MKNKIVNYQNERPIGTTYSPEERTANMVADDINDLRVYFNKLFDVMDESGAFSESEHFKSYATLDMICNIYSLLDFWLKKICEDKYSTKNLSLRLKDIRGNNDLAAYDKYLTKVACADMHQARKEYNHLQQLRELRNCIIHAGSHSNKDKLAEKIENIKGVSLFGTLICISRSYVFESLDAVEKYVYVAVNA